MTTEEFSNEFDTMLSSYNSSKSFGEANDKVDIVLDEYEKSVFLTKAQEEIIIELYTGKNQFLEGFEKTEELRRYLEKLVKTVNLVYPLKDTPIGISDKSIFFQLPDDLWFITYESVILNDDKLGCHNGNIAIVVPVTQDEYYRINRNPFRRPSENRVLRLDISSNIAELVSDYIIDVYTVRYLAKPNPIILVDLGDLSINGINTITECELNPVLHRPILDRAVRLAIVSKTQGTGNK